MDGYNPSMQSPFPGLDPYLQEHWGDVHARLITYAADAIAEQLPDDLMARIEERVFVETEGERWRSIVPDVFVKEWHPTRSESSVLREDDGALAIAEPVHSLMLSEEPITEGYIEIRDTKGRQVITVIEIVSPANRAGGEGQRLYLQKQEEVLQTVRALVEIDFIRGGNHVLMGGSSAIAPEYRGGSLAATHAPWRKGLINIYAFPLRERLKSLPVPLRQKDKPVILNLQELMNKVYANGQYGRLIDYAKDAAPALNPADAKWANELLTMVGRRSS